jgi:hypothetical protein
MYNKSISQSQVNYLYNSNLNKFNNTKYIFYKNESLNGVSLNNYNLFFNDTSNNINQSNRLLRILSNVNMSSNIIKILRENTYGANFGFDFLGGTLIDANNDGIREANSNLTWHREKFLDTLNYERRDSALENYYNNETGDDGVNFTTSLNLINITNEIIWSSQNNVKYLLIINYMPSWLADNSSGTCSNLNYCVPNNYTKWQNIVKDYIYRITSNGTYNSTIEIEVWNEPDSYLMNKLSGTHMNKSIEYNRLYNSTYTAIKSVYPNMPIFGAGISNNVPISSNISIYFLANFSNRIDGYSAHFYPDNPISELTNKLNLTRYYCNLYSANCSRIIISEMNILSSSTKNSTNQGNYTSKLGEMYSYLLNSNENITTVMFDWSSPFFYGQYTIEYPSRWAMLSEPLLNNTYYTGFNILNKNRRYAPSLGTVYQSSNDNSELIQVQVREVGGADNLIVTNTYNDQQNITLNCGSFTGNLMDTSNGNLFSCASGSVNIGVLDAYDVRYYTEPILTQGDGVTIYRNYLGEYLYQIADGTGLGATCDTTTLMGYNLILIFSAVAIFVFVGYKVYEDGFENVDLTQILLLGVGVIVAVILFQASADNLAIGSCG